MSRKKSLATAGVVSLIVPLGFTLLGHDRRASDNRPVSAIATVMPAASANTPGQPSTSTIDGEPTVVTTTQPSADVESATAAAVRFLELDEQLLPPVGASKARVLIESVAASSERRRLGDLAADEQDRVAAKGDLGDLRLRIAPIAARTRDCGIDTCTVDIYFLRLWSFPGKGALDDYATAEVHVRREAGGWRLVRSSVIDGPYPAGPFGARSGQSVGGAASFESALNGFTDEGLAS